MSSSGYQPKRPKKEYRDNIHRLLDQEWEEDTPPRSGIDYDYRHLLTSQSVLRSEFPDAVSTCMINPSPHYNAKSTVCLRRKTILYEIFVKLDFGYLISTKF